MNARDKQRKSAKESIPNYYEKKALLKKMVHDYSAAVAFVLINKCNMTGEQTQTILDQIAELFEDMNFDRLSVNDIVQALYEEQGIEIV